MRCAVTAPAPENSLWVFENRLIRDLTSNNDYVKKIRKGEQTNG
jgi:hypothetical protein